MNSNSTENVIFKVVVNHEGQYSLWPGAKGNAPGWSDTGTVGSREQCLAYIEQTWVDMRPISLRLAMERHPHGGLVHRPSSEGAFTHA